MSSEERKRILQMVEDGRITADEAMTLIKAIEADVEAEARNQTYEAGAASGSARSEGRSSEENSAPELEETAAQARRLAQIPLVIGIVLTVLSAVGMYAILQRAGDNFWFYCLIVPLLLGALATALGAWSRSARWLFVRVDRAQADDWPRKILLGFPLPLELAGWFLRMFGGRIQELKRTNVDEVVQAISMAKSIKEPLIVNVDEGEGGEHVQVFIG